eukprot:364755-Chlamydomonas_euryale.AAC.3
MRGRELGYGPIGSTFYAGQRARPAQGCSKSASIVLGTRQKKQRIYAPWAGATPQRCRTVPHPCHIMRHTCVVHTL